MGYEATRERCHLQFGEHALGVVDHGDRQVQVLFERRHYPLALLWVKTVACCEFALYS